MEKIQMIQLYQQVVFCLFAIAISTKIEESSYANCIMVNGNYIPHSHAYLRLIDFDFPTWHTFKTFAVAVCIAKLIRTTCCVIME